MIEEKIRTMSSCCGATRILTSIYLMKPRELPYEGSGREEIGDCPVCSKCLRPIGERKMLPNSPADFSQELWRAMIRTTPGDRFYCERRGGKLEPYGNPPTVVASTAKSFTSIASEAMERLDD